METQNCFQLVVLIDVHCSKSLLNKTMSCLSYKYTTVHSQLNSHHVVYIVATKNTGGSVAEWLACWTQEQKVWVQIAAATLSGNSLKQTVHTHRASVHQAAKLVAALLKVAGVTAGLAESNGSLPPGL